MKLLADSPLVARVVPARNYDERRDGRRPDLLLLHYTGMTSAEKAIEWLALHPESRVSCHYLVDEDGAITQMVPEELRAWHAGVSHWAGETDLNSASIGIEIHNPGYDLGYRDFPARQMKAVADLSRDIITRNHVLPWRIVGHSDIAPARKGDPGHLFDWRGLAREGVGVWVKPAALLGDDGLAPGSSGAEVAALQLHLWQVGYGVSVHGRYDTFTEQAVLAFQRHWRQALCDGRADASTIATLSALVARITALGGVPRRWRAAPQYAA